MTSLWRNHRYVAWLIGDTGKGLAFTLFGFAVPLLALIVTNDPAQAGIIGAVGMAVRLVLTLYGGVLADRHPRVRLMILGSVFGAVIAAGFTLLAVTGALSFTTLLVVEVLLAVGAGLFNSAGESALKEVVTDGTMGRAQAANQARDAALQLAGGPLGGALLVVGGWLVGAVMAACHLVAAVAASLIPRVSGPPAPEPATALASASLPEGGTRKPNAFREIREGFTWLFSRADLRGSLVILTIINLGINIAMTTVIYSLQQGGYSTAVIGLISTGLGAATLVGALAASALVARIGAGKLLITGLVLLAAGSAAVALVREPLWIIAVMIVPGLMLAPINAALGGYFMVATPSAMMGRASSASNVLGMGAMPLAPLVAGFGLTLIGREGTILIGAGLCAIAALLALMNRGLRSLPAEAGWAAHARRFEPARAAASVPTP